jgi:outer membrane receptor protein involved in Fe transport
MPDYATFDASIRYGFKIGDLDAKVIGRMNNVFNTEYIPVAQDGGNAQNSFVWFGYGRTFNVSAKIKF